ncbi:MAG: hypothetical protein QOI03_530 [Solirubrobacteraceae bacterium]|nr:hypothetical protein [Solirubrobacteraceae bacterium]
MTIARRAPRPSVELVRHPLWRIRLAREWPRYLLSVVSAAGLAASARYAIAPPRPSAPAAVARAPERDLAAEGYAVLFARRYLTWDAADPEASTRALASFSGPGIEAGAGLQLPVSGSERVSWAQVVQQREPAAGEHVYTVAAQTGNDSLLYLSVSVVRTRAGSLALGGYPAFVGAPAAAPAPAPERLREVADRELATVVTRALRNYLGTSAGELAADLTSTARVSLPTLALSLVAVQRLCWSRDGRSVLAVLQAQDARGVRYALAYELDVTRVQGRWEISAVQMDPNA